MKNGAEFLKSVVRDSIVENLSVDEWVSNGKWASNTKEFLKNWYCHDIEIERKGRTDAQMACDLADELKRMKKRNVVKMFVASNYLENGNAEKFDKPLMNALNFEEIVDNVIKAMK